MTPRQTTLVALIAFLLVLTFRTFVSGWGPPASPPATASATFGIAAYPADNLSYSAWAQQSKGGRWRFGILYTTTEHQPLMVNSLFLLIGRAAALLAVSPVLVLNVLAAFALPVFVLSFSGMCRGLGLGAPATFAATCLAIGGGGISWIRRTIEWSGANRFLPVGEPGPDLSYYDVYPVAAYFIAPYHAIALAIVAVLVFLIVRADDHRTGLTLPRLALLAGTALLLATVRPHISIVLLGTYGAMAAASAWFRLPRMVLQRRITVAACLTAVMVPPILYSVWVSQQPVWRDYSLAHRPVTHDWAIGFFCLWVLAAAGAGALGSRALRSPFAFLVAWASVSGLLLLILNGYLNPKLSAGSTIALAVLAGVAVDRYKDRLPSRRSLRAALAVIALVAVASPTVMVLKATRERTGAASELFRVIETIRNDTATPFPTVLADCGTGVFLPGLGGYRVFCGHWALTENNRQRIVLLSRLGFLADGQDPPSFPGVGDTEVASGAALLGRQIAGDTFQYVVVRKAYRIHDEVQSVAGGCTVHDGTQYLVVRMCPDVKTALERRLRG